MTYMLMGAFENPGQADQALRELETHGYTPEDISAISKTDKYEEQGYNTNSNVAASAGSGAVTGGVLGGLAGLLTGIGVIPAVAGFFIGGPIAAAIGLVGVAATTATGAVTGGAVGGLLGALVGLGIPKNTATSYHSVVNEGGVVLGLSSHEEITDEARQILNRNGARDIHVIQTEQVESTSPLAATPITEDTQAREDAATTSGMYKTPSRTQPAFGETRHAGAEPTATGPAQDSASSQDMRDASTRDLPTRDAGSMREERRDTLREEDL